MNQYAGSNPVMATNLITKQNGSVSVFKSYESRPVTRLAHQVTKSDVIQKCQAESTSAIEIDGEKIEFKHYEPVSVGDWIVYLNESDIYHCTDKVFRDRNVVP